MLFVHCRAMFHSTEVPNLNITVSCQQYSYASATIRTVPGAFHFWAVQNACVFRDHILRLLTVYLINRLWEFHLIYNFGAVGNRDELIRY